MGEEKALVRCTQVDFPEVLQAKYLHLYMNFLPTKGWR